MSLYSRKMLHVSNVDFQLPFLQCFLSKEIKTIGKENSFHSGKRWRHPDFHLDFLSFSLWISTSYFLQFPLLCKEGWCSQSPHQSGYSHLNLQNWKSKNISKSERLEKLRKKEKWKTENLHLCNFFITDWEKLSKKNMMF